MKRQADKGDGWASGGMKMKGKEYGQTGRSRQRDGHPGAGTPVNVGHDWPYDEHVVSI